MSDTGARQLMARMTARGLVIQDVRGGKVQIETSDVAAALALGERPLSEEAYVLGRVKYCDDDLYRPRLARIVFDRLAQVAGGDPPRGVVAVCLKEGVWRPVPRKCGGRGCGGCRGLGLMRASNRDRAKRAGVPKTSFNRHWARAVERVLMNMDGWGQECLWHLYDQFRRSGRLAPPPEECGRIREIIRAESSRPARPSARKIPEKNLWKKNQGLWPTLGLPEEGGEGEGH